MNLAPAFAIAFASTALFAACTAEVPETMSKEQAGAAADKGDSFDYCAAFDWYGDGICDTFCADPDPDCGLVCEPADCGPQPEFQPRICDDGTFIFPNGTCQADQNGNCGWDFHAESCPEDNAWSWR